MIRSASGTPLAPPPFMSSDVETRAPSTRAEKWRGQGKLAMAGLLLVLPALAACGARRDLEPAAGQPLPPVAYGRQQPRSAEELLRPSQEAAPERNVELRRQSEERADDPFDLPPEG